LPEQRGLLVAGDAGDRHLAAQVLRLADAEHAARSSHLGECAARHIKQREQIVVPGAAADVVQHGA
jgi:hypothetical protein